MYVFICEQYIVDLVLSDLEIYKRYLNYVIFFWKLDSSHDDDRNARGQAHHHEHLSTPCSLPARLHSIGQSKSRGQPQQLGERYTPLLEGIARGLDSRTYEYLRMLMLSFTPSVFL